MHRRFGPKLKATRLTSLERSASAIRSTENFDFDAYRREFGTLHLLVDSQAKRRHEKDVVTHLFSDRVPEGSLYELKRGVYVASVALCLLHASRRLSMLELVRLCFELCACYELVWADEDPDDRTNPDDDLDNVTYEGEPKKVCTFRECVPITTVDQLSASLSRLEVKGSSRIRWALRFVADGSASPRETDLAMYAWLPNRLGGHGFRVGTMNQVISIAGEKRRCDLFFGKERVGVEYDSDEWHLGSARHSHDSARTKEIERRGYHIVSITNGELRDFDLANAAMALLGRRLGRRVREPRKRTAEARLALHAFINTSHQPMF